MHHQDGNDERGNFANRQPDGTLQVSTDGWMVLMRPREQAARMLGKLSPNSTLAESPVLAVLMAAEKEPFTLRLASGHSRTIPTATEHLYLAESFVPAILSAAGLDIAFADALAYNAGSAMPSIRKVVEETSTHYVCPQTCDWQPALSDDADPAVVFHDGSLGVRFVMKGGSLAEVHWLNRRPEPVFQGEKPPKARQLTRQPLGEGPWFIGGHPVVRQNHPF